MKIINLIEGIILIGIFASYGVIKLIESLTIESEKEINENNNR